MRDSRFTIYDLRTAQQAGPTGSVGTVITKRSCPGGSRGLGFAARGNLEADGTYQLHVEDLNSRIRKRHDHGVFVLGHKNLFGVIHVNRFAADVYGESSERCLFQRRFEIHCVHIPGLLYGSRHAAVESHLR